MLRVLLGEPPRKNSGVLADAMENMATFAALLRKEMSAHEDNDHEYRKLEIWTRGLISSLDELEQSWFAAAFYRKLVIAGYMDDMTTNWNRAIMHVMFIFIKMALSGFSLFWTSLGRY